MPPAKRATPEVAAEKSLLEVGQLINLDRGGRTLQNLEVLGWDEKFLKLRWDIHVSPQTEIVLVPWGECVIGLVGER
jgi:hypothetical protein